MLHKPPTKNKGNTKKPISRKSFRHFWKIGWRLGQKQKNEKTEGATGLGKITREQIERWNEMTARRFQTGETSEEFCFPSGKKNGGV